MTITQIKQRIAKIKDSRSPEYDGAHGMLERLREDMIRYLTTLSSDEIAVEAATIATKLRLIDKA